MSEVLARIRVRETHGIRRFLYPLTAYVNLPLILNIEEVGLADQNDIPIPLQLTSAEGQEHRLDFAVSLEPLSEIELRLFSERKPRLVDDPLHLNMTANNLLQSAQKQFAVSIADNGNIRDVVYDNVAHLREPTEIRRPDRTDPRYARGIMVEAATERKLHVTEVKRGGGSLAAWSEIQGTYSDGCKAFIKTEITACKSWVMTEYRLEGHVEPETIFINIPFLASSSRITFDTGIGDGLYGKVSANYVGLGWYKMEPTEEITKGYVMSFHGKFGKNDYIFPMSTKDLHSHCWFHLIDDNKSVAIAITKLPAGSKGFNIKLYTSGWIEMSTTLNSESEGPAEFGVCYHFLNDIPAIAAATNPQSILLPPTVEVLPV